MKHKHTLKYLLYFFEAFCMLICFILGVILFDNVPFWFASLLVFAPFVYGYLVKFSSHITYLEAYERALTRKLNS